MDTIVFTKTWYVHRDSKQQLTYWSKKTNVSNTKVGDHILISNSYVSHRPKLKQYYTSLNKHHACETLHVELPTNMDL